MSGAKAGDDQVFLDDSAGAGTSPEGRPGGLTVICVLAMVLGGMGVLAGCFGLAAQALSSGIQQAVVGMPGQNMPGAEAQRKVQEKMMAVGNRYKWVTLSLLVIKIFVEAALVAGALLAWGLNPRGWSWLHGALIAVIVFECVHAIPQVLIQVETQSLMKEMMAAQQARNQAPPGLENMMSSIFSAAGILSLVFISLWLAGKLVFYVVGIRYLRKPGTRALFAAPASGV
jgi:hypothetical protein